MSFRLRITSGKGEGKEFTFTKTEVRVGRTNENDLVLYDLGVSRQHFAIREDASGFSLRDLGSSNGTRVNGEVAVDEPLYDGDEINIGAVSFIFNVAQQDQQDSAPARRRGGTGRGSMPVDEPMPPQAAAPRAGGGTSLVLKMLVGLAAMLALALVAAIVMRVRKDDRPDQSHQVFAINELTVRQSFGHGNVDVVCKDKVTFSFAYTGGKPIVHYMIVGADTAEEVEIRANDFHVGYAPLSPPGAWTEPVKLALPLSLMRPGSLNVVTFDNKSNPPGEEFWGVTAVRVAEEQLLPPNPTKSQKLFKDGMQLFSQAAQDSANLYQAYAAFSAALDNIEAANPRPPLYQQVLQQLSLTQQQLVIVYDQGSFGYRQALERKDTATARKELENLLRVFPDPDDARHRTLKRLLASVNGEGTISPVPIDANTQLPPGGQQVAPGVTAVPTGTTIPGVTQIQPSVSPPPPQMAPAPAPAPAPVATPGAPVAPPPTAPVEGQPPPASPAPR